MKKRLISTLLTIAMLTALLPTAFAANTVTRAEWISQLVEAFSMTVEDDSNMPDNYFSDITESDSYYRDILLAVEFGVIDLEAGEAFEPNENATREFAAQTLNSCLQFQLDEGSEYTFSEADSVTYPDDIQAAINRNWFALSGDNFLPEQAITSVEATAMLADAKSVIDSEIIDENYNSSFEFAEGVIVIPETAQTSIDENNTVTITDNKTEINADDFFVVYTMGIPVAFKATAVETIDNTTVISATKDGAEGAIVSADAQGKIDVDIEDFEAEDATTYSITNTRTNETEEMEIQLYSIDYDESSKTVTASHNIKIGSGIAGSISAKISNIDLSYKFKDMDYEVILTGDTNVTTSVSFDFNDYAGIPKSISLGSVRVMGIGKIALDVECSISGGIAMSWDGALKVGVAGTAFKDARLIKSFTKKGFTITAEVNIGIGLKLSAGVDIAVLSGTLYATIGAKGSVKATGYSSGIPVECATIKAYMYAAVGANVTVFKWKAPIPSKDIFTESNSPIRVCYHYEDGKLVDKCTRGATEAGDAYVTYTTPTNSKHFNPSPSYAQGSYGGSSGGSGTGTVTPVVIWEYKVESDGNATITKYKGSASAVAIPSKIDGYTVTKIGEKAFSGNTVIRSVTIPDTVVEIGSSGFYGCVNLSNIKLSKNLTTLGQQAFQNCSSLTSIEIPRKLDRADAYYYSFTTYYDRNGIFSGTSLKNVSFENGMTKIPANLFINCDSLEEIEIPDTVIAIGADAFHECSNLAKITIHDSVTSIGGAAFYACTSLTEILIPDSVVEINYSAFYGCTNLSNVKLSKNLTTLGQQAFQNCSSLTSIEIPRKLDRADAYYYSFTTYYDRNGIFSDTSLKNVSFENGVTQIPANLFIDCDSLEKIDIPDTVITIGSNAFHNCSNLAEVTLPDSVTTIGGSSFDSCTSLTAVLIPDSVIKIDYSVFYNCTTLSNVKLSRNLTTLGQRAFENCSNLASIEIPKTLEKVDAYYYSFNTYYDRHGVFSGTSLKNVSFENGMKQIPNNLFIDCDSLEKIDIPNTVITIGANAFHECSNLAKITIPDSVTSIGGAAFSTCKALENISIPNSVKEINYQVFYDCSSLKEINIPDTTTLNGDRIFYNCTSLKKVKLPNVQKIIDDNTFYNCSSLTDIELPATVTSINKSAFYGCSSLENISIPENLTTIGNYAFYECSALKKISVPESVTSFGYQVFYNCDALETATVNSSSIGSQAFYDCDELKTLTLGDSVISIGSEMCYDCDSLTDITFGKYITNIPDSAFRLCPSLTTVTLPRFCTTIAANAFAEDTKLTSVYMPVSVKKFSNDSFSYPIRMTMYGKSGSYAEEYAESRNMTFSATNAPITKIDYTSNSIDIARYAKIRPTLNIEPTFDISVVTFASSDENILTVSETGEIYGKNYGTATITATSDSGVKDTITVNVVRLADSVSLDKTELELESGDTAKLNATLKPSDATDKITWKSSNENIAIVNNGTVTAVGAGTAVITVTTTGGKTASCTVKVTGTFIVTATADENGTISPSGEVSVKSNAKATFNILPDYGYVVKDVLVNGTSVGAVESYTFSNLTDNATITAEFAKVNVIYENNTITISSEAALKDLKLIIANYDDESRLTNCEVKTVTTTAGENYQDTITEADNMKLMLWSGLNSMRPIWCSK